MNKNSKLCRSSAQVGGQLCTLPLMRKDYPTFRIALDTRQIYFRELAVVKVSYLVHIWWHFFTRYKRYITKSDSSFRARRDFNLGDTKSKMEAFLKSSFSKGILLSNKTFRISHQRISWKLAGAELLKKSDQSL